MDWKYIAGFFDGEGSISHNGSGYRLTISQTNEEVLEAIRAFTKTGKVLSITKRKPHWKDSWVYNISKQKDIEKFLLKISPNLIVKKPLALKVLLNLKKIVKNQTIRERKSNSIRQKSRILRKKGYSYRQIGKTLNIDWGYARRLTLK